MKKKRYENDEKQTNKKIRVRSGSINQGNNHRQEVFLCEFKETVNREVEKKQYLAQFVLEKGSEEEEGVRRRRHEIGEDK